MNVCSSLPTITPKYVILRWQYWSVNLKRIDDTGRYGRKGCVMNLVDDDRSVATTVAVDSLIAREGKTIIRKWIQKNYYCKQGGLF